MASSLSNFVNKISGGIHKMKCKYEHDNKKCKTCGIRYRLCNCFLEYTIFKDGLIKYKCLCCNKNFQQKFDEKFKEWFLNTYNFSSLNNKKQYCKKVFILLNVRVIGKNSIRKHTLPGEEDFYIHLIMEDITDVDYVHAKRVLKPLFACT